MALDTYGGLKTLVASYLSRADLTSQIADFVTLAHKQLMRDLRGHPRLNLRDAAFSITGEYVACPAKFMALTSMHLNTTPRRAIQYMETDTQDRYYGESTGIPAFVSIVASTTVGTGDAGGANEYFRFAPVPGSTYTATMEYTAAMPFFTADSGNGSSNWILADAPDLYLYGSLLQANSYIRDDPRIALWAQAYQVALESVKSAGNRARWGANGMAVRVA